MFGYDSYALFQMKKKRAPTAYTLWCSASRPKILVDHPELGGCWCAIEYRMLFAIFFYSVNDVKHIAV